MNQATLMHVTRMQLLERSCSHDRPKSKSFVDSKFLYLPFALFVFCKNPRISLDLTASCHCSKLCLLHLCSQHTRLDRVLAASHELKSLDAAAGKKRKLSLRPCHCTTQRFSLGVAALLTAEACEETSKLFSRHPMLRAFQCQCN